MQWTIRSICLMVCVVLIIMSCGKQPNAPSEITTEELIPKEPLKKTLNAVPMPFWARTDFSPIIDGYGTIYFYILDPMTIPADFNFHGFFDPRALSRKKWAVKGFAIYDGPPSPQNPPKKSHLSGTGAVPFWFFPESDVNALLAKDPINLADLVEQDPIVGYATHFVEELHPFGGHPEPGRKITAKGILVDAEGDKIGTFRYNFETHHGSANIRHGNVRLNMP